MPANKKDTEKDRAKEVQESEEFYSLQAGMLVIDILQEENAALKRIILALKVKNKHYVDVLQQTNRPLLDTIEHRPEVL